VDAYKKMLLLHVQWRRNVQGSNSEAVSFVCSSALSGDSVAGAGRRQQQLAGQTVQGSYGQSV